MVTYFDLVEFQDIKNYVLLYYLSPLDVLRNRNIFGIDYAEKVTLIAIEHRLKLNFRDEYSQFKQFLNNTNIVLSSSFIIETILGDKWYTDIDLYTDMIPCDHKEKAIVEYFDNSKIYKGGYHKKSYEYFNNLKIRDIVEYNVRCGSGSKPVKIIYLYHKDLYENVTEETRDKNQFIHSINKYIKLNFDFDICTNIFYVQNGVSHITFNCINGILNKKIKILNKINILTNTTRIDKYDRRKFSFDFKLDPKYTHPLCHTYLGDYYYICNQEINDKDFQIKKGIYALSHGTHNKNPSDYIIIPDQYFGWEYYNILHPII
jgi:hypothetical protein